VFVYVLVAVVVVVVAAAAVVVVAVVVVAVVVLVAVVAVAVVVAPVVATVVALQGMSTDRIDRHSAPATTTRSHSNSITNPCTRRESFVGNRQPHWKTGLPTAQQ
jgi:hypothetical protein